MEFKKGAEVCTADGKTVGHVNRVVLNPLNEQVTDLIVQNGIIFTTDKVLPFDWIATTTPDKVILRQDLPDLNSLPDFTDTYYINLDAVNAELTASNIATPLYWYPPIPSSGMIPPLPPGPVYREQVEEHIPEGTIALKTGARVLSSDGNDVGEVSRVFTNPKTDQITHILVEQGLLKKTHKLIPVNWIQQIHENQVTLGVHTGIIDRLAPYEEPNS